ncbi:MAG TPA: response regulator [Bacteroidia bacterium]|nr:response regulator [Bacteroidia bacterium]
MTEKINILLVEDNPGDARLIDIFMKEAFDGGYVLSVSEDLASGLSQIKKHNFDIIIADLSLPDSDGLDTFKTIHENAPDIPTIVLTGLEDESVGINAMKFGAQDFLIKGKLKSKGLKRSIDYSIERNKLLKALSQQAEELKQKSEALLKEQIKLEEAQKIAHIGSWELDFKNYTFKWSDELYRIYGVDPATFTPTIENFIGFIHPEDKEFALNIAQQHPITHHQNYNYRIIRHDGEIRTINGRGEPIFDEHGTLIRAIGTAQDITERLHEEELEKLALAATKSYNSVIITDPFGKIEWANDGFSKLTGYAMNVDGNINQLLKRNDSEEIKKQEQFYKTIRQDKNPITYEHKNFTKEGKEFWVITTLTPVLGVSGEVERIIAIDSDISVRKQMEEELLLANKISEHLLKKGNKALNELLKTQKELKETMKVKEQFLANMSHEIRTPMNAIIGFTDLILKTTLNTEQKQYVDAIKTSGQNLLVIVNDILDFSKSQAGKLVFEQIDIQLSQAISTLVDLMLPKSMEKNIRLSFKIDPQIPDHIIGDPTRLNQILINLVGNAIKFTEEGEIKIGVQLISETEEDVELRFSVHDTGIGIPADKLDSIFEGFTQATNETTRKYGGTGLGLTIVKQLVEQQGGQMKVESSVNKGSVFSFNLSFKKGKGDIKNKTCEKEVIAKTLDALNVLLVEDNYLNQVLATKVLTNWNWKVDVAGNGKIAVEKLQENNYDIILMDIQMPEMDGYEATKYIRTKLSPPKSTIPIIAMTAHAISGEIERCEKVGMNDYISKPFNEDNLYSKILTVLKIDDTMEDKTIQTEQNKDGQRYTDLTYLKKLSKGDNDFVKQMISIFIDQTPTAIQKMEADLSNKDWASLRAVAHKMKPSFSFVGVTSLQEKIETIEDNAAQGINANLIADLIAQVKEVSLKAVAELQTEKIS